MKSSEMREGGCLCGAVRYRLTGPVAPSVHCHCTMCRRASGAPVVTWLTVPSAGFAVIKGALKTRASSSHGARGFCPDCGAQMTFVTSRRPDDVDVSVGTLDKPEDHPPRHHIWTSSRLSWLHLDEHLPDYPESSPGEDGP